MSSFQHLDCPSPGSAVNDGIKWHMRWLLECSSVDECRVWLRFTGHRKPTRVAPLLSMAPPWNCWVPVRFQDCLPTLPNEPSELEQSREEEASRCLSRGGGECECSRALRDFSFLSSTPTVFHYQSLLNSFCKTLKVVQKMKEKLYLSLFTHHTSVISICANCTNLSFFLLNQPSLNYLLCFYCYHIT